MSKLERLGTHVSSSLEHARTGADADASAARVRERLARGEGRSRAAAGGRLRVRRGAIASALAVAATILVLFAFARGRAERPPLTFVVSRSSAVAPDAKAESGVVGAFLAAPASEELPISFSDGTRLEVTAGSRARVAEVNSRGARVLVESGVVRANVVHAVDTQWLVDAGPFEVKVTGTRFDVGWQPEEQAIVVTLHEGSVFVKGCGLADGQRVFAGQQLHASCKTGASSLSALSSPPAAPLSPYPALSATAATALPDAPPEVTPRAPAPLPASASPSAFASPSASPSPSPSPSASPSASALPSAADLFARADVDRYAGRFDAATESLDTVRRRFRGSDAAATAAFELGRIAFDGRHDFGAAGDWFETYLRERPAGAFAREALGRAIEARHRAGDAPRAAQLAARYVVAYPEGPHAPLARRLSAATPPTVPSAGAEP